MPEYNISELEELVAGKLAWPRVQEIMKDAKDTDRFEKWLQILQKQISWSERILLPLSPNLFIVQKADDRIVKCRCGHEFGDYLVNCKRESSIFVRETARTLQEIYRGMEQPDPSWTQVRTLRPIAGRR